MTDPNIIEAINELTRRIQSVDHNLRIMALFIVGLLTVLIFWPKK